MNALSEEFWDTVEPKGGKARSLTVRDTPFGFVVRVNGKSADQARFAELVLKALGLAMIPGGLMMLAFSDELQSSTGAMAGIGLPAAFSLIGVALFFYANRGFQRELQVDGGGREIRIGVANSKGAFHERQRFTARDIDSAFLSRSKDATRPSQLCLRRRGLHRPVLLIEGDERSLQPILERTALALKGPKVRRAPVKRRLTLPLWKKRANNV